ncbi:hypothetical protein B5E84_05710 [Lachnoclostridium sp. An14]|nr:hypothetical protein B5E84_05710 [Lachnoclostridium sp. An14]
MESGLETGSFWNVENPGSSAGKEGGRWPDFCLFNRKLRLPLNKNAPKGGALRGEEYGCWRSRAPPPVCAKRTRFIRPKRNKTAKRKDTELQKQEREDET